MKVLLSVMKAVLYIIILPVNLILWILMIIASCAGNLFRIAGGLIGGLLIFLSFIGLVGQVVNSREFFEMFICGICFIAIPQVTMILGVSGINRLRSFLAHL